MRHKQYSKRAKPLGVRSVTPAWVKVLRGLGLVVAIVAILNLGLQCIWYLKTGDYFGHKNFWNQDVGTLSLAAVLLTVMATGVVALVKCLKTKWKGH